MNMSINKFGAYVHPYFSRGISDSLSEGLPKREQVVDYLINIYGSSQDNFTDYIYTGVDGKIEDIQYTTGDMVSVNNEQIMDLNRLVSKHIKKNDVIRIYHTDKKERKYSVYVDDLKVETNKSEDASLKKMDSYRTIFKFPLQSGNVIKAEVSPSKIVLNSHFVQTLENVKLKNGDVIEFFHKILFFEANLIVRSPIKESA